MLLYTNLSFKYTNFPSLKKFNHTLETNKNIFLTKKHLIQECVIKFKIIHLSGKYYTTTQSLKC